MIDDKLLQKIAACVPIFSGMPLACLLKTIACADHWPLRKGDLFFSEGDGGYSFFVLLTGKAVVVKWAEGEQVCLARLGPGDCFGEMALVNSLARSATVRAESDVLSLRFSKEKLDAYPEAAAFVYRNIAKVLAQRLSSSNEVTAKLMLELAPPETEQKAVSAGGQRHTEFES
jgi:CRP-like cAMP-binding protein